MRDVAIDLEGDPLSLSDRKEDPLSLNDLEEDPRALMDLLGAKLKILGDQLLLPPLESIAAPSAAVQGLMIHLAHARASGCTPNDLIDAMADAPDRIGWVER